MDLARAKARLVGARPVKRRPAPLWCVAVLGLAVLAPLTAQAQTYQQPGWGHGWGWGFGHMAFGGLMMLLFWGVIIVVIVFAVRWISAGSHGSAPNQPPRRTPREILEERFARGEIDKEEFEERKRLLSD
jgi:putative membrane protein